MSNVRFDKAPHVSKVWIALRRLDKNGSLVFVDSTSRSTDRAVIDYLFIFFSLVLKSACVRARLFPWQPGALANSRLNSCHPPIEVTGRHETDAFGFFYFREYARVVKLVSGWSKRKQQLYLTVALSESRLRFSVSRRK